MTGERMETVREALTNPWETVWLVDEAEPERGEQPTIRERDKAPALAEVERWEHGRARLTAIETAARAVFDVAPALMSDGPFAQRLNDLWAALGEGQDSDLAAVGSASGNDGTAGIATPDGTTERVSRPGVPAAARSCCGDPGDCGHHPDCAEVPPCRA